VRYRLLPWILEQEGSDFYRLDRRWQPKDLIPDPYRRNMLKDAQAKLSVLEKAEDEFQTLTKSSLFIGILKDLRLVVRRAQFAWRTDDLKFIEAISEFYSNYGTLLQQLKHEHARGRFKVESQ